MANARTILPELISVSRNCGFTMQLHQILSDKLEDTDFEILHRWLQIVEEEKRNDSRRHINKFGY